MSGSPPLGGASPLDGGLTPVERSVSIAANDEVSGATAAHAAPRSSAAGLLAAAHNFTAAAAFTEPAGLPLLEEAPISVPLLGVSDQIGAPFLSAVSVGSSSKE